MALSVQVTLILMVDPIQTAPKVEGRKGGRVEGRVDQPLKLA